MGRLQEIEKRKLEIRSLLEKNEGIDLDALETELRELEEEKKGIEKRNKLIQSINDNPKITPDNATPEQRSFKPIGTQTTPEQRQQEDKKNKIEERAKALREGRSITTGNSTILLKKDQQKTINGTFNPVSSIIDLVNFKNMNGGESYEVPYVDSYGEGNYTAQGAAASTTETKFKYAAINKTKVTAYQEVPEEIKKLADIDYTSEIETGLEKATRKKLAKEILVGDGSSGHLVGIFSSNATAIDSATDLEIDAIENTTLDDIVYSYGGDEETEGDAVLILNKKDLAAFAKLRDSNGNRIHEIRRMGATGTIDEIPYVINSACVALADASANDYMMAYGSLQSYDMVAFSDLETNESRDYKFKEGLISYKTQAYMGGNVVAKNAFLRIKKKS